MVTASDDGEPLGHIEKATRADIAALGKLTGVESGLAEAAYALAYQLDSGKMGMATAAVARELRMTVTKLAAGHGQIEDDDLSDMDTAE